MNRQSQSPSKRRRRGTTVVEMAVVLPVFGIFMAGLMEVGHAYMVMQVLNSAAKQGARVGAVEGRTTQSVIDRADDIVSGAINSANATIIVKDGSVFDEPNFSADNLDYNTLDDIELSEAESSQLYIVRLEVPYDDVSLLPPFWIKDVTLTGMAVMRHE